MTDAEFLRFLRHGGSKLAVVAEFEYAYESAGSLATGTFRIADRPGAVSDRHSYDALQRAPELERSIDLARLGGRGSRSGGTFSICNSDGAFDWLLDAILDGRDCATYIGEWGAPWSDFRLIGKGVVAAVRAMSDHDIEIEQRDQNFLLDDSVIAGPIASGPNEGRPKPLLFGQIRNFDITPYLLDSASLTYYIGAFALDEFARVQDARDNGVSLDSGEIFTFTSATMTADAGTETLTRAAHGLSINDVVIFEPTTGGPSTIFAGLAAGTQYWVIAAGFTLDNFRLSLTKGGSAIDITGTVMTNTWGLSRRRYYVDAAVPSIELSGSPAGRVTVDVDCVGATEPGIEPHSVMKYLLATYSQLGASDYDEAAIDALTAIETASINYTRAVLDRANLLPLFDEIAMVTDSWYSWGASGVLTVGRVDLANLDAATADDEIDENDVIGDLSAENLPIPFGRLIVDHTPNVVVQTDGLAASVSAEDRSLYAQQYQARLMTTDPGTSGYLANWWDYHKSAIDSPPAGLPATTSQARVDATTAMFAPWTRVHRCTVGLDKYALNPGDCVRVTYPRYGLDAGKNCRVISVRPRPSAREVDLVLVRQAIPDYQTAVH